MAFPTLTTLRGIVPGHLLALLAVFAGFAGPAGAATRYHYRVLGDTGTYGNAINQLGQMGVTGLYHQQIWNGWESIDTGIAGWPTAINDRAEIVGWTWRPDINAYRATLYSGGSGRVIEQTLGGRNSWAYGINNAGTIVGVSENAAGYARAFVYTDGRMADLGSLGGTISGATAINDAGQIVGYSLRPDWPYRRPFLYDGTMHDLGSFGADAQANAINDLGQVVGSARLPNGIVEHAFLYSDGKMRDLGTFGGGYITRAFDINNHGDVVGMGYIEGLAPRAFLYSDGKMIDLNELADPPLNIPYFSIEGAYGINDDGEIAAVQCWENGCNAVLMIPVPEPAAWVMLVGGLGLLTIARPGRNRAARAPKS